MDFEAIGLDFDLNETCAYSTNEKHQLIKKEVTPKLFAGKRHVMMKEALEQIHNA